MASSDSPSHEDAWPYTCAGYELIKHIGKGAFANVHSARVTKGPESVQGRLVAVKIIDLEGITSDLEDIRREVTTLRLCLHPNVLQYYISFVEGRNLWLVTQLMSKGSCLHVMTQAKRLGMPSGMREDWVGWILQNTLQALKYFHEQGQIHRDIKAGNILLDSMGNVALADFGVSRWVNAHVHDSGSYASVGATSSMSHRAKTFVGTPCWMAPEVMEQLDGYDFKADIWSLGITALELAKGNAPYANHPPMKVLMLTIRNDPPSLKTYKDDKYDGEPFSQNFKQFVRMCLCRDPAKRPTCTTLLAHKFFTNKAYSSERLVSELLDRIDDVNDASNPVHNSHSQAVDVASLSKMMSGDDALDPSNAEVPTVVGHGDGAPQSATNDGRANQESTSQGDEPPFWKFTEDEESNKRSLEEARTMQDDAQAEAVVPESQAPSLMDHADPHRVTTLDDRSAQEEYAKLVGGIQLMSEEEVSHLRAQQQAVDDESNNDVINEIQQIVAQVGGEGRRPKDIDRFAETQ